MRKEYAFRFAQLDEFIHRIKINFICEVGFKISLGIKHGRSLIGTTNTTTATNIRSHNISVCCALRKCEWFISNFSENSFIEVLFSNL